MNFTVTLLLLLYTVYLSLYLSYVRTLNPTIATQTEKPLTWPHLSRKYPGMCLSFSLTSTSNYYTL